MKTLKDFIDEVSNEFDDSCYHPIKYSTEKGWAIGILASVASEVNERYTAYIWQQATEAQKKVDAEHARIRVIDSRRSELVIELSTAQRTFMIDKDSILNSPNA